MKFLRQLSIKYKLIIIVFFVGLFTITISSIFTLVLESSKIKETLELSYKKDANLIGEFASSSLTFSYPDRANEILAQLKNLKDVTHGQIYDNNMNLFAFYSKDSNIFNKNKINTKKDVTFNSGYIEVFLPIYYKNEKFGYIFLRADTKMKESMARQIMSTFVIMIISLVIAYFITLFFQKFISGPILKLAEFTNKIKETSQYNFRITKESEDEVGLLYDEFNLLLDELNQREKERDIAQNNLLLLNRDLEKRVQSRTLSLEKAYNELKDFAYIVSHDLKSPIRGISQPAYWLLKDNENILDDNSKELLNIILMKSRKLDNLINSIQLFVKIASLPARQEKVNLFAILNDIKQSIENDKNVDISIVTDFPIIYGNRFHFENMFYHLLDNAVKFNDKPNGYVRISHIKNAADITFIFEDNGMGIDAKYHNKIFKLFQSLEKDESTENTGVGLTIVKKIVDIYDGDIQIESEIGVYTKFFIRLSNVLTD